MFECSVANLWPVENDKPLELTVPPTQRIDERPGCPPLNDSHVTGRRCHANVGFWQIGTDLQIQFARPLLDLAQHEVFDGIKPNCTHAQCVFDRDMHIPRLECLLQPLDLHCRYEWLDQYNIESIEEAQDFATQWLWTYNNDRPNMGIGGITPAQKLNMAA
jgi:hypothetical protein